MTGKKAVHVLAMMPLIIGTILIGLAFSSGYWHTGDSVVRWILLFAFIGGVSYIFIKLYRAIRKSRKS